MKRREIEGILRELGGARAGVVAREQLLERGLSISTIDRLVRVGRIVSVHPGVYQVGPLPLPRSAEHAALLAGPLRTRLSHTTAARIHGLDADELIPRVEVTMERGRRYRLRGVDIHHVRDLLDDEATMVDGLRVTTIARTLLDLAWTERPRVVEQAYAMALRRRLVTPNLMRAMVERHPNQRGAALWRRLLAAHGDPAFARSRAEETLLDVVRSADLPAPELNARLQGHEVDFLWREQRVVAEVDGYVFHASAAAFGTDRRRAADLAATGYRVLRFTWSDLKAGRLRTVARLARLAQALLHAQVPAR